ncbi:Uncharacterised protein [Streptococcus dysgalactiae]|nr:Uncharacterised protein [Streptococcus dysgalactiae]
MGVFTDEFKGDIAMAVREEFKVSFVEFLSKKVLKDVGID